MNVTAAEALVCFFLYGNSILCRRGTPHNYMMCRDIGLVSTKFTTGDVILQEVGTGVLRPHPLGLEYTPRFHTSCLMEKFNVNDVVKLDEIFKMCKEIDDDEKMANLCKTVLNLVIKSSLGANRKGLSCSVLSTYNYHFRLKACA